VTNPQPCFGWCRRTANLLESRFAKRRYESANLTSVRFAVEALRHRPPRGGGRPAARSRVGISGAPSRLPTTVLGLRRCCFEARSRLRWLWTAIRGMMIRSPRNGKRARFAKRASTALRDALGAAPSFLPHDRVERRGVGSSSAGERRVLVARDALLRDGVSAGSRRAIRRTIMSGQCAGSPRSPALLGLAGALRISAFTGGTFGKRSSRPSAAATSASVPRARVGRQVAESSRSARRRPGRTRWPSGESLRNPRPVGSRCDRRPGAAGTLSALTAADARIASAIVSGGGGRFRDEVRQLHTRARTQPVRFVADVGGEHRHFDGRKTRAPAESDTRVADPFPRWSRAAGSHASRAAGSRQSE